jgi:hypothetical protein
MPSSLLGILRPNWPTWPAPDAPDDLVCEVVQQGVEEAGQGGQEGLEGALIPGEGQGRLGESRRGPPGLPNAPKCSQMLLKCTNNLPTAILARAPPPALLGLPALPP